MSTESKTVSRIAWLVGDRAINEFEAPMLRSLGFDVYQTPHAPLDRGPEGECHSDAFASPTTLPADERAILDAHDFYEHEMTPVVARILNRQFNAVVCSCCEHAVREILTQYRGRVIVRATPAERRGFATYGERLRRRGAASLSNLFREAGHRMWFAPIDDVLPEKEDSFLRSRFIRLPTGIPDRAAQHVHTWDRDNDRVLVFQLDSPSYANRQNKKSPLEELLGAIPAVVAGRRPKADNDGCAAAFLPANVLERWPWTFGESTSSAGEFRNYPHHPFEAILRGMPTVYMRDPYVDRLGAADLPGACTSLREARRKLQRVLDGDQQLIELLRGSQSVFLSTVNPNTTRSIWMRDFADGIMTAPIESPPEARALERTGRERRLAVILPGVLSGAKLRTAVDLVKMLKLGSQSHEPAIDVVVAAPIHLAAALAEIKELGVQIRPLRWKTIRAEAKAIADLIAAGIAMKVDHEVYAQPVDGGNDLLDCDSWLVVGDAVPFPLLPIRPYGAVLFDYPQRFVPELFDEKRRVLQAHSGIPFAREAKYVIVTTPSAYSDVNAYAGVPRRKIWQAPLFFDLPPKIDAPSFWSDDYFVWHVDDDLNNVEGVLTGLNQFFTQEGGQIHGVIVGSASRPHDGDNQPGETPRVTSEAMRAVIDAHPTLRMRIKVFRDGSDVERARVVKHAKFLLHANIHGGGSLSVVDAASLGVGSLSARYPAMEFLDRTCGLNMAFFDPRDPLDLVRGLREMQSRGQSAPLPERGFLEAFHWKNAVATVCGLVFPHVECVPAVAYR